MATQKENKHSLLSILLIVIFFGTLASLVFISVDTFQAVREKEQLQIRHWLGHETDQWIMGTIIDFLMRANEEGVESLKIVAFTGKEKLDAWLMQRVYAALIWCHVVFYRAGLMIMWLGFGIPLLVAAILDGYYQREISKATFAAQSPILHKGAIDAAKWSIAILFAWIFVPVHITMLIAPICISIYGVSIWTWYANMQKRM